jgi:Effector protein
MRYWGMKIEIDGSFYKTDQGKRQIPAPAEVARLKAANNMFQFEGNVDTFETTVQNMMRDIQENAVGKVLLDAINRSKHSVRVIPLTRVEQESMKRVPQANCVGRFDAAGNDCVIWFEPWSRMWNLIMAGGSSPYQVLVHEMQHGLRQVRGKWYPYNPVGAFPNVEELFSVMIENMYLSAAGQPARMLGSYRQDVPLGTRTDIDFYKQYGNEIEAWCKDLPDLTILLERVFGTWNPILVRRNVLDGVINLFPGRP